MKKKFLFYLLPLLGLTLTGCRKDKEPPKPEDPGDTTVYDAVVNDKVGIVEKETGYLHQLTYEGQVIDIVGYEESGGKVGSIKRATYNGHTYNGMIYNRSLITNLDMIRVDFTGGDLQYIFSDFLMEDMDFESKTENKLVSGQPFTVPAGKGYFVLYTKSTTPVNIDGVMLKFKESGFDAKMIYNKNSTTGGARSNAKWYTLNDSYIEMENNPTVHTNNYSHGHNIHDSNDDAWYRWNGRYFANTDMISKEFSFGVTVMGEYNRMVDESKLFHYGVWPQFSYYDSNGGEHHNNNSWAMAYIGNDNYEPRGKDAALFPSDPYVDESYSGRFFSDYGWYDDAWKFPDPDTTTIVDGSATFRSAYQAYDLPFWFIRFDVYFDAVEEEILCDVSINGFKLFTGGVFGDYDFTNNQGLGLNAMHMHLVNYGVDAEATPAESYTGCFSYPRLIER